MEPMEPPIDPPLIASANGEVRYMLQLQQMPKRGPYMKFTLETLAEAGKRAAEHSVAAIIHYYYYEKQSLKMGVAIKILGP